jgi:ribonuclease HII
MTLDFAKEKAGWSKGFLNIAGIDEAGRGPLAGPVVAAAVIFPPKSGFAGLNDSKKLSAKKREALFDEIKGAADVGVGIVSAPKIDEVNIFQATRLAMKEAVEGLAGRPDCLLIDGNIRLDLSLRQQSIKGGDGEVASIAAASIIAKVTRDRLMIKYHQQYPQYGFDSHKGYGSKKHMEALREHGLSPIHRKSFKPKALEEASSHCEAGSKRVEAISL